jgi:hypothetical protein
MLRVHNPNLASSCRQGERCTKDTDHQVVHSVVHLANHRSTKEQKSLKIAECRIWARRGVARGLGWSDPVVRRADAPNMISEVAPAQAEASGAR